MKSSDLLLVIDFQNVYLPGNDWACPSMPGAIEHTRQLLSSSPSCRVLFTQYLAARTPKGTWARYNEEYRSINEDPYLCDIVAPLKPFLKQYPLAVKSTYSSLKSEEVLAAAMQTDTLVLTGVVSECCVLSTMMEAIDLGLQVIYLTDCVERIYP